MSWYDDPYRHPPPYEYASLNQAPACEIPRTAVPFASEQYVPLRFAAPTQIQHQWPSAHSHGMVQPPMIENYENVPPTTTANHDGGGRKTKKKRHHEAHDDEAHDHEAHDDEAHDDEAHDHATTDKRSNAGSAQIYDSTYPPQYPTGPAYNLVQTGPVRYNQVTGSHELLGQQTTVPTPHISSECPSLPGAARYMQKQSSQSVPPLPLDIRPPAFHTYEQMASEHHKPPPSSQDQKRRRIERAEEHQTSHQLYPPLPQQSTEASTLPRGTQHNPLEIPSSPEQAPKSRSSNKKRKKKNFYAVTVGHVPGIYEDWNEVERQITRYSGAKQRGFATREEAVDWWEEERWRVFTGDPNAVYKQQASVQPDVANVRRETYTPVDTSATKHPSAKPERVDSGVVSDAPEFIPLPPSSQNTALPEAQEISIDPEPILKPEQQKVVDLILQGHNVFYTGSAGCGKSTILKAFVKQLQLQGKHVKIVAPTNLAALNVGGVTTWNFAGWTPDSLKKPLDKLMASAHGNEVWERFNSTDVLVIDEISMVENLLFERLNHVMQAARAETSGGGPFGGVQIIVTGDFCQLSPVKPFQYCIGCGWELIKDNKYRPKEYRCENKRCREDIFYDIDKWAFRSKAWKDCDFKHINLTEIHRQSDKKFISILQKIRTDGVILPPHANILLNHTSETQDAIQLFSRRDDVDRINNDNVARLPTEARTYKCLDHFSWKDHHRKDTSLEKNTRPGENGTLAALKEHRYEVFVQLKEGMRIVLQANLDPGAGLVNGSQGMIIGFEPFDPKRLPRKAENRTDVDIPGTSFTRGAHARYFEEQIKIYGKENNRQPWPIVKFDNGLTKTIFADCTASELGNEEPYSLLSRTQIPLMAGYAITVHKSQGMTLDRVIVDLSRAFEPSQIYVALSRARSLKGLRVVGLPRTSLGGANEQVKEFFQKYLTNKPVTEPRSTQ